MPREAPDAIDAPGGEAPAGIQLGIAKRRVFFAAKLLLAAGLLWLLVRSELLDFAPLQGLLQGWWIPVAVAALVCIHWPIAAWRWHLLLHVQGIAPRFLDTFRVAYGAAFLGLYLPGGVGSDVARIGLGLSLSRSRIPVLALSVVADRILGVMGLMVVGLAASLAYLPAQTGGSVEVRVLAVSLAWIFAGALAALFAGAVAARRLESLATRRNWAQGGRLSRAFAQAIAAAGHYLTRPATLAAGLALSVIVHALNLAALVLVAYGIGLAGISLWTYALAGAISVVANALPITPGGLGVGEAAFSQLVLWLEPSAGPLPYATAFLAYRVIVALTLCPALAMLPASFRSARKALKQPAGAARG